MMLKIFKILTSLILLLILATLVTGRTFKKTFEKEVTGNTSSFLNSNPPELLTKNPTQNTVDTEKEPTPLTQKTSSSPQVTPLQETTSSPSSANPYIAMKEGASDTDESYRPTISPCITPMTYSIGTFDTRFNITKETFIQETERASLLWSNALGKKLFTYKEQGGSLTLNLIYDQRQANTVDVSYLILDINNAKHSAQMLQEEYEQEKITYQRDGEAFTADSTSFQERYTAYSQKVEEYNARGGAKKEEYDAMMQTLTSLQEESKTLEARRLTLVALMESINKKVARYNEFVIYINTLIVKSNTLGAKKFTEGRFVPSRNTIDIYQYADLTKLRRVITHELGHALGVNHNNMTQSIMYSVNSGTSTELSKEDISDLKEACASY